MARIRLSLEVSPDLYETLEHIAAQSHTTKADVLRRAIALMDVVKDAQQAGLKLGLVGKGNKVEREIVGL